MKQIAHVEENLCERRLIAQERNEIMRTSKAAFTADDKSGSDWHYMPMPSNQRDNKGTTSDYKYRMCLQVNLHHLTTSPPTPPTSPPPPPPVLE